MKCTACGSTNLRRVNELIGDTWSDSRPYLRGEAYVCLECGHIEIYSSKLLEQAKKEKEKEDRINSLIKQIKDEAKEAEDRIPQLEEKLAQLKKEQMDLEDKSRDLDITVRQQKDILDKIAEKELDIKNVENEIKKANAIIKNVDYKISRAHYE